MIWVWAVGPLPDDPLLHVCAAADVNDMTLLDSVLVAQRLACAEGSATDGAVTGANLDHAM
jgi:acyl-CoA thioesterase-2